MHFVLLRMLLFTKLFWYKERVVSLFTKNYYKCSIYAFVSNLTILAFSKVMNGHFLCVCVCVCVCVLGGDKAQRWGGGGFKSVRTMLTVQSTPSYFINADCFIIVCNSQTSFMKAVYFSIAFTTVTHPY